MKYEDEDVMFAHKILHQREELDQEEVDAWLQKKEHVDLLNRLANAEEENHAVGDMHKAAKSDFTTFRRAIIVAIVVVILLLIKMFVDGAS